MTKDDQQDKNLANLWSEFVVVKHVVQGNGSPGLAVRVAQIEARLPEIYEKARIEFREALMVAQDGCPARKSLEEHLDYHKVERAQDREDRALSREIAHMRESNELMNKSLKVNIAATLISGLMMVSAILGLILRGGAG
jgi:hypothetical protein